MMERFRSDFKIECIDAKGKSAFVNPAKFWLDSKDAVHATDGFMFDPSMLPGGIINNEFNLFVGWGTGDLSKSENTPDDDEQIKTYFSHLRDVICGEAPEAYRYIVQWMAHLVQKPDEKPGVALIIKGGQGTGKGMLVKPLGNICGSHFFHATKVAHVAGKFNALLQNKLLTFADEFSSSEKASYRRLVSDALKSLVTEDVSNIEPKGKDIITVACYMRLIVSSNHDSPIDIAADERRYLVVDVPKENKRPLSYFKKLDFVGTMSFAKKLHSVLLRVPIESFNPFDVPQTKELQNQKMLTLSPPEKYVYDILESGHWRRTWREKNVEYKNWPEKICVKVECEVDGSFQGYLDRNRGMYVNNPSMSLGKVLNMIGGVKKRMTGNGLWYYQLPSLEVSRKKWDANFKIETNWDLSPEYGDLL